MQRQFNAARLHFVMAAVFAMLLAGFAYSGQSARAGEMVHKVAVHVDSKDPKLMGMALNNVQNVKKYYDSKGEKVQIELVAYGPGLHMLRADTSPVKDRIEVISLAMPELQFSACGNTYAKMSKKAGKDIELLPEATKVPSGVVRLIELQESGYSYIRP